MTAANGYADAGGYNTAARATQIAAIHGLGKWLADNPDVPMPTMVTAEYHVTRDMQDDEWTRVAGVLAVLHRVGASPYEGALTVQGDAELAIPATHGITIIYRAAAHKDPTPAQRYVTRNGA